MTIEIVNGTAVVQQPKPPELSGQDPVDNSHLGRWRIDEAELAPELQQLREARRAFQQGTTIEIGFVYKGTPYRGSAYVVAAPHGELDSKPFHFVGTGQPVKRS